MFSSRSTFQGSFLIRLVLHPFQFAHINSLSFLYKVPISFTMSFFTSHPINRSHYSVSRTIYDTTQNPVPSSFPSILPDIFSRHLADEDFKLIYVRDGVSHYEIDSLPRRHLQHVLIDYGRYIIQCANLSHSGDRWNNQLPSWLLEEVSMPHPTSLCTEFDDVAYLDAIASKSDLLSYWNELTNAGRMVLAWIKELRYRCSRRKGLTWRIPSDHLLLHSDSDTAGPPTDYHSSEQDDSLTSTRPANIAERRRLANRRRRREQRIRRRHIEDQTVPAAPSSTSNPTPFSALATNVSTNLVWSDEIPSFLVHPLPAAPSSIPPILGDITNTIFPSVPVTAPHSPAPLIDLPSRPATADIPGLHLSPIITDLTASPRSMEVDVPDAQHSPSLWDADIDSMVHDFQQDGSFISYDTWPQFTAQSYRAHARPPAGSVSPTPAGALILHPLCSQHAINNQLSAVVPYQNTTSAEQTRWSWLYDDLPSTLNGIAHIEELSSDTDL